MKEKTFIIKSVHTAVHTKFTIVMSKPNYSIPKIYIPKDLNGKPTAAPGKQWHIYYYFRNPNTDKMQKFMHKENINLYKTVKERKEYGTQLCNSYHELLKFGFDPFTRNGLPLHDFEDEKTFSVIEAIDNVIKQQLTSWKKSTATNMVFRMKGFKDWCKEVRIDKTDITEINKKHIIAYLKTLNHLSNTSIDNYRRAISAVFGVMSGEGVIPVNIAKEIPKIKSKPQKNIPFTSKDIENIKKWFSVNDPLMLDFIKFVFYGFLRPIEVVRLEIQFMDLENNIYRVETKRDKFKTKTLEPQLKEIITRLQKTSNAKNGYIFTDKNVISEWHFDEKQRYDHFNRRFRKVKTALGFGKLHGMHSLRHSAVLDQYNYFKKEKFNEVEIIQKMLPITGHKTEDSLRAYLRDIDSNLPKGYARNFSIDL
ncbi:tyrosine-type recombinase/integrase [Bizionia myxarmorum]|uniref:Tyrosine-type recombinase/integrase n=1 Tax=Bizionia myxarmorum TaxID=291186 RepID=A0A5D0R9M6_9FLAO|nr:tyrosine-type recombinase/integrase [Bizionia myxarmorum]TYB78350.1 tyrosine-type recombinase/integrase [Bizionia myxarmorum]